MKYLHICPAWYDYHELGRKEIIRDNEIIFYSLDGRGFKPILCEGVGKLGDDFDPKITLDELGFLCDELSIDAITSSKDYPGALLASFLADQKGYLGVRPEIVSTCQHKYFSRCMQQQFVPEATPLFILMQKNKLEKPKFPFPLFAKPVKSSFSIFAHYVQDEDQMSHLLGSMCMPQQFLDQFNWFLPRTVCPISSNDILIEEYLVGNQVTLEAYIFDHQMYPVGIVDSVMFPNTICFKRFEYPSQLDQSIQERMINIAKKFITAVGLNNGLFNIEFIYNPDRDTIHIIEVNPRMSPQFADLFEKVDGTNTFEIMLSLGVGRRPVINKHMGSHGVAASFVLRIFEDKKVVAVPTEGEKEAVISQFPDMRLYILIKNGMNLSDLTQDGKSYRYGLVHLGAGDRKELYEKYEAVCKQLTFKFA